MHTIFAVAPSAAITEIFGGEDTPALRHGAICVTCWEARSLAGTCQRCDI